MATVKVILRKDKINEKTNLAPLFIRIIKDRKSKFISLGVKVDPKFWNEEKMCIKKGFNNYIELNNFILHKRSEAEKISLELEANTSKVTTSTITKQLKGKKPKNFFQYADDKMLELKNKHSYGTILAYQVYLNKLEAYCGNRNLEFNDIDLDFIKAYEKYLYEKLGNNSGTVLVAFKIIKIMFNFAINEDLISLNQYPFRKYSFKKPITNKNYLNEDQFKEVLNYDVSKLKQNEIHYDMFIFACYAGGLRFSDVVELKWIDFLPKEQYIVKVIQKTKRKHQFKLPQKAISIIEKYRRNEYKSTDFIFPLLKDDFDYSKTQEYLFKDTAKYNTLTNQTLNKIGKELKLPFPLTFHTSRHTFATRALNKGMRIEHVSKILDHTNISITQIYAKIINKELDKAMDIMDE